MATTIDYASDYGGEASDYQTTMKRLFGGKTTMAEDFEGKRLCPLMDLARVVAVGASKGRASVTVKAIQCKGGSCSWWDADKERCAVLSLARNK